MSPSAKNASSSKSATKKAAKKATKAAAKKAVKSSAPAGPRTVAQEADVKAMIRSIALQVAKGQPDPSRVLVLGVRTRGVPIADRLRDELKKIYGVKSIPSGILDITLYRDDLSAIGPQPMVQESDITHDVTAADVILVDDVLFTGRTVRAALDEIVDFGRPARIRLAVLVDRGWREYPIQADYVGMKVETTLDEVVHVRLDEIDGEDEVVVVPRRD